MKGLLRSCVWVTFLYLLPIFSYSNKDDLNDKTPHILATKPTDQVSLLDPLSNICLDSLHFTDWWTYILCYKADIKQIHLNVATQKIETEIIIGKFDSSSLSMTGNASSVMQIYVTNSEDCYSASKGKHLKRKVSVLYRCCDRTVVDAYKLFDKQTGLNNYEKKQKTFIEAVYEPLPCSYSIPVCTELLCAAAPSSPANTVAAQAKLSSPHTKKEGTPTVPSRYNKQTSASAAASNYDGHTGYARHDGGAASLVSPEAQLDARNRVKTMFFHAYNSYMKYAYPLGELKPLTCTGGSFDLVRLPLVTLIDALDTLVVMGEFEEFRFAVELVRVELKSFDFDVNVSLFETTIRVLGGLLSAHLMAVDPELAIYVSHIIADPPTPYFNLVLILTNYTNVYPLHRIRNA